MRKIINLIFSVIFSVLIIITIVKFTVGFKQLYYFDINYLNIPILSGLSKEEIKENWQLGTKFWSTMDPAVREDGLKGWKKAVKCALFYAEEE